MNDMVYHNCRKFALDVIFLEAIVDLPPDWNHHHARYEIIFFYYSARNTVMILLELLRNLHLFRFFGKYVIIPNNDIVDN